MNRRPTTGSEIAAALRAVAADLDSLGETELSELAVAVSVQACSFSGTADTRSAAVDRVCQAVANVAGEDVQYDDGSWHHVLPYDARYRDGIRVDVHTSVQDVPLGTSG